MTFKAFGSLCGSRHGIGLLLLATSGISWAQEETEERRVRVIEPDTQVQDAPVAAIDTERYELGFYTGTLAVEDFGSDLVTGLEFSYHLTSDWLLQLNYGIASIDEAAFETSQRQFLASDDRDFEYISITGGYRLLRGRSFFGTQRKYDSDLYLIAGPDRVSFAANDEWGLTFGLSYRIVFTDWMTGNVDFREHLFDRTFIGESKQTLNTEFRIGVNALF